MADDPVAAFLAEVRERADEAQNARRGHSLTQLKVAKSAADVPRLLAVAEAVLKMHRPIDRGRVMNCCHGCESVNGDFHEDCCHEWPCPTYEAISAALLGEGEAGG